MALIGRSRFFSAHAVAWRGTRRSWACRPCVYDSDHLLAPHASWRISPVRWLAQPVALDLRGLAQLGLLGLPASLTMPGQQPLKRGVMIGAVAFGFLTFAYRYSFTEFSNDHLVHLSPARSHAARCPSRDFVGAGCR
jgi:hypothetical protein